VSRVAGQSQVDLVWIAVDSRPSAYFCL
jgi:hypothetical protein